MWPRTLSSTCFGCSLPPTLSEEAGVESSQPAPSLPQTHTALSAVFSILSFPYSPVAPSVGSQPSGWQGGGQADPSPPLCSLASSSPRLSTGTVQGGRGAALSARTAVPTAPGTQCPLPDPADPAGRPSPAQSVWWLWHLRLGSRGPSTVTLMARW